jgi:hypothetical protein
MIASLNMSDRCPVYMKKPGKVRLGHLSSRLPCGWLGTKRTLEVSYSVAVHHGLLR